MAKNRPFSDAERSEVLRMLKEGKSSAEIAARFDRPRNSICRLAAKCGVSLQKSLWSAWEIQTLLTMREEGKTPTQIAQFIGRTYDSVKAQLGRLKGVASTAIRKREGKKTRKNEPLYTFNEPEPKPEPKPPPPPPRDIYFLWRLKMARVAMARPEAAS